MKTRRGGYWAQQSRLHINAALATLPADATKMQARRALTVNYPFAEYKGWAYRCWLKEVKKAMLERFPEPKEKPAAPTIGYRLDVSPPMHCAHCAGSGHLETGGWVDGILLLGSLNKEDCPSCVGQGRSPVTRRVRLRVACRWCGDQQRAPFIGCLMCARHLGTVARIAADPDFFALRHAAQIDPAALGVLADWLKERGLDVEVPV